MHSPRPDTSEYAALVDFIATGGRSRDTLKATQNPQEVVRHALAPRARAVAQAVVAVARAALTRRPPAGPRS